MQNSCVRVFFVSALTCMLTQNWQNFDTLRTCCQHVANIPSKGEVRAAQVFATLVNGMQGHTNCNDSLDVTYLPILLGYWSCYKRYMASLGYVVGTTAMRALIVMGVEGQEVDAGEYCSFPTYFNP